MAAILPKEETASLGKISLLAGFAAISFNASTCFKAITTSLVPDSIIEVFILSIAAASAFETSSIALALPSASSNWDSFKPSACLILASFSASALKILACFSASALAISLCFKRK